MTESWAEERILEALDQRRRKGTLRSLEYSKNKDHRPAADDATIIDFSSNDYLGLAHDPEQAKLVEHSLSYLVGPKATLGATGSRLLSGDAPFFHELEAHLANVHQRPAAMICNSGYDANLSVVSSLACDCIIYDEYSHNSLHMGIRLWQHANPNGKLAAFRHNDVQYLRLQLEFFPHLQVVVIIESVYSMDGDVAPVKAILDVCRQFNALLVVDEAHGLGVFGKNGAGVIELEQLEHHPSLLCSIYTFGKAAGCHGAVVVGSATLKSYLTNYGYPFIYSTALPFHSLVTIKCSYETMTGHKGHRLRAKVFELVRLFRKRIEPILRFCRREVFLLPSTCPIQALMIPGNDVCSQFCQLLYKLSKQTVRLYPIKSPTVPSGKERIRIIVHAHNTANEVETLVSLIRQTLAQMQLLSPTSKL